MGAAPLVIKAIFSSVTSIQETWVIPKQRYSKWALLSLQQLSEHEYNHCLYVEMQEYFQSQGINLNAVPLIIAWIFCTATMWK